MKITKIRSNIKSRSGEVWSYDVGDRNLLIGPNESGKSAVGDAIQLATCGSMSNLFLKDEVKRSADLQSLIPAGTTEKAFAEVTFSNGEVVTWEKESGKAPKSSGRSGVVFPSIDLRKVLQGSEERITKFLFSHFGREVSVQSFKDMVPAGFFIPEKEFNSLLPDLGTENLPEILFAEDYLDMADDAAKIGREESSKSKFFSKCCKQFSVSSPGDEDLLSLWEELASSIRFEQLKKMYRNGDSTLRQSCQDELRKLGTPEELKELRGSAFIHDDITDIINSRALYDNTKLLRDQSIESSVLSKNMSVTAKAMVSAIRVLTVKYLEQFTSRVSEFLPKGEEFFMEITPASCSYGLKRDGERHRALSGSTEARVLAAMACAIVAPNSCAVVVVDDRMWDSSTLAKTMAALEGSPCQVIMMTTTKPRGRKRAGWNYIEMGEATGDSDGDNGIGKTEQPISVSDELGAGT